MGAQEEAAVNKPNAEASLTTKQQGIYERANERYAARFTAMPSLEVVRTKPEHFEPISNLTLRAYEPVVPEMYSDGYAEELSDIQTRAETSSLFTALLNGQIIGSVAYVGDRTNPLHCFMDSSAAYIRFLAVDPSAQRVGAGRALTERCVAEAIAEGKPRIGLHTLPSMSAAIALYTSIGFVRSKENDGLTHVGYCGEAPAYLKVLTSGD